ncbi:unnamed protein product [Oikopleura dioica]|uniref:Uncharacterized protein n=1 Tax=Oikopleura dioica TaxID=34765 RepID=E4Y707_OIKDI|nr:unnamed protein product [Oikopleura dioica]
MALVMGGLATVGYFVGGSALSLVGFGSGGAAVGAATGLIGGAAVAGLFVDISAPEKNIVGTRTASGAIIATSSPSEEEIEGDVILRDTQIDAEISAQTAHAPKS